MDFDSHANDVLFVFSVLPANGKRDNWRIRCFCLFKPRFLLLTTIMSTVWRFFVCTANIPFTSSSAAVARPHVYLPASDGHYI